MNDLLIQKLEPFAVPLASDSQNNGEENPSPTKRLRTENSGPDQPALLPSTWPPTRPQSAPFSSQSSNGLTRPPGSLSSTNGAPVDEAHKIRFATKPVTQRPGHPLHYRDSRRSAVVAAVCQRDDAVSVLDLLREISSDSTTVDSSAGVEIDTILDDNGHTALHIAASLARMETVNMLLANGADMHRGNFLGETPLVRACIATTTADQQSFTLLLKLLQPSIRTLDTARKSVLHHIVALAGVKGRAVAARYYLDEVFLHIAKEEQGDFKSIVNLQDENGDTALNIAARVGNRSLVRTMLDVGANRMLPNKLGLRPGDFGVETEVSDVFPSFLSEMLTYAFRS